VFQGHYLFLQSDRDVLPDHIMSDVFLVNPSIPLSDWSFHRLVSHHFLVNNWCDLAFPADFFYVIRTCQTHTTLYGGHSVHRYWGWVHCCASLVLSRQMIGLQAFTTLQPKQAVLHCTSSISLAWSNISHLWSLGWIFPRPPLM
jgi:hypothetical protein